VKYNFVYIDKTSIHLSTNQGVRSSNLFGRAKYKTARSSDLAVFHSIQTSLRLVYGNDLHLFYLPPRIS